MCGGGSTAERRSSRRAFERMSGEYLEESVYGTSRQAAPPASADISISPLDATIPTRGYAELGAGWLDLSESESRLPSGRKLNLGGELTDVARGTRATHVYQYDAIRDHQGGHEYGTPRGEKYRHKLLGPEERMLPSQGLREVNAGLPHHDRPLPQGRTHISDSITACQSLEAIKIRRYPSITSTEISLLNEPLVSDINLYQVSSRPVHCNFLRYHFQPFSLNLVLPSVVKPSGAIAKRGTRHLT